VAATRDAAFAAYGALAANASDTPDRGIPGLVRTWPDPEGCPQVHRDVIDFVSADGRRHQEDDADHIGRKLLDVGQHHVVARLAQPRPRLL
jgi:hypothetical protein